MFDPWIMALVDERHGDGFCARWIAGNAVASIIATIIAIMLGVSGIL
jgi:hypothetical protein